MLLIFLFLPFELKCVYGLVSGGAKRVGYPCLGKRRDSQTVSALEDLFIPTTLICTKDPTKSYLLTSFFRLEILLGKIRSVHYKLFWPTRPSGLQVL